MVPDAAELLLDVRTVPSASGDASGTWCGPWRARASRSTTTSCCRRWTPSLDDGFVALVGEALAATGLDGAPAEPARFFTDASALIPLLSRGRGDRFPTVILGPGEPDQCHVADEWCSLEKVDRAVEVYAELLHRWCG